MFFSLSKKQTLIIAFVICAGLISIGIALTLILTEDDGKSNTTSSPKAKGGVVSNGHECAEIGKNILEMGGSAVDSAIAILLCEGVSIPQSMGVGGGFFMTIYDKKNKKVETINSREVAPLEAYKDMFQNNSEASSEGGLAIAVPGELKGYEAVHKKYGKLPWKELFKPTIELCRNGIYVTATMERVFKEEFKSIMTQPSLSEIFVDPETNRPYKEGDYMYRLQLASTFEIIAEKGAAALYDGELTDRFIQDIQDYGGIIKKEDLLLYEPVWNKPETVTLPDGLTVYTIPLPGSGVVLNFILSLIKENLNYENIYDPVNWQRIVESFKFGYGERTHLGDPYFTNLTENLGNLNSEEYISSTKLKIFDNSTSQDPDYYGAVMVSPEDHGTAHVSVLAPNGDAVSATSTINLYFGSKRRSRSTGIILNDEMDDFSSNFNNSFGLPPGPANFIEPRKHPMSSMCPTIIIDDDGNVRMVIGAAGGSKITTSVAEVIVRHLWMGQSLYDALQSPRVHHQLFPMEASFELDFPKETVEALRKLGHVIDIKPISSSFAAVTAIASYDDNIELVYDKRRPGSTAFVY